MSVVSGPAHAGLTHGLSRMMGNHQVRFLGEGVAVMPPPYPTRNRRGVSRRRLYAVSRDKAAPDESGAIVEGSWELLDLELPAVVPASGVFEDAKDGLERAHKRLST